MVRFDDNLNARINRVSKNVNAKNRYNKYKTRGKGILPRNLSAKQFKLKYSDKSREELFRQLKLYEDYGKRDALDLAYPNSSSRLSKWEKNYFESNREKTRQFYDDEIADLERIIGGHPEYHLKIHERLLNLQDRRKELDKDLASLTDDQIKGLRATYNYAERSELVKEQGFRTYLAQLERTMKALGKSKSEIENLLNKFNVLSENEFTEMIRNEDLFESIYYMINSPKGRGKYELMDDTEHAKGTIRDIENSVDEIIAKYKTSK